MDMDMDLDELEEPRKALPRSTRFAPKNSKSKPIPKNEPPKPELEELDSKVVLPSPKQELAEPVISTSESSRIAKVEIESCTSSSAAEAASNGDYIEKMDIDWKPEGNNPEEDNHQDEEPVVREIDVFFTPSMDSNTQVRNLENQLAEERKARHKQETRALDAVSAHASALPSIREVQNTKAEKNHHWLLLK